MIKFYRNEETKAIVVALQGEACPGMKELVANTTDAAQEKHVPVVTRENGKVHVQIGSVEHPMLEEHHIEWIALES
ncbi:MAG: desulfoferrodoxin, partial [Megasphaera micronuciformis]|nr:desulfoferrodoxin [Megasphaera micronuciformis]